MFPVRPVPGGVSCWKYLTVFNFVKDFNTSKSIDCIFLNIVFIILIGFNNLSNLVIYNWK